VDDDDDVGTFDLLAPSDHVIVWQTLASRRAGYDAMMWQTPALGMTAQAFLFTLALNQDSTRWARLIASSLSLALSLMVVQLMAKHRRHEALDSWLLRKVEARLGLKSLVGVAPHGHPSERPPDHIQKVTSLLERCTPGPKKFWAMSSFELWMFGQYLFAAAALLVLVTSSTPAIKIFSGQ
jgi:hypothetical protein